MTNATEKTISKINDEEWIDKMVAGALRTIPQPTIDAYDASNGIGSYERLWRSRFARTRVAWHEGEAVYELGGMMAGE
jgi:hypothetical protein